MGDRITILFDQEIECNDNCVAYMILDSRVSVLTIDVSSMFFYFTHRIR